MDTQEIVKQFRLSSWSEAVKERIASGQKVSAFCEEKGISKATYYYRQRKVREAACAELASAKSSESELVPNGWTQLAGTEDSAVESTLNIEAGGCRITANAETDPELLAKICRILRSL